MKAQTQFTQYTVAPILSIEKGGVSWHISNSSMTLVRATNVLGPWTPVLSPYVTNGSRMQVLVPCSQRAEFFRLLLP